MIDNGPGIYVMSNINMNIIQQIYYKACAIYQVVEVYEIYQSIKLSIMSVWEFLSIARSRSLREALANRVTCKTNKKPWKENNFTQPVWTETGYYLTV